MSVMTAVWSQERRRVLRLPLRLPFLVAFAAAALAAGIGRAVTTTYLPVLLDRIDDAPGLIGVVMLVNAAAGMVVPLVTGLWSDRLARRGRGRRLPFVVGGAVLAGGGLAAIALGSSSSYLVLALAAAVVYTGLNALTTAHRALVPELFSPDERARATSAQELSMLVGGLLGLAVGGALTGVAPWAPFALSAVLVPVLVLPTLRRTTEPEEVEPAVRTSRPLGYFLRAAARPGVRGFLTAQILWVLGYAALPAFFLLYAEDVLDLRPAIASLLLAGFGLATGAAIAAAGRVRKTELHRPLLLLGIALMGVGFLGVSATTNLGLIGVALLAAATGFGLISTIGFPLFSELIPDGESGGYTALYFSVRSISSTIALPAAGGIVATTGSYRALFVLGGTAALAALVPFVGVPRIRGRGRTALALLAVVPVLAVLVSQTGLHRLDERLYSAINGLGPGPDILWTILDPHTRNYLILLGIAFAVAIPAGVWRSASTVSRVFLSAVVAWALLEAMYQVYNRDRPEEVLADASLNGHTWARLESFPSGHMAITAALAVALALAFPRLRGLLYAYIAAVAFTRVFFGAHFPLDTVAGTALGTASALVVAALLDRGRTLRPVAGTAPVDLDPADVVAVMPTHDDVPERALVDDVLGHVGRIVLVDDGSSPAVAARLDELAEPPRVELVRLPAQGGKGSAVRAGIERALAGKPTVDAVLVIDADGQHPAAAIPDFLEAGRSAELVVGDRFGDLAGMPWQRRLANRTSRRLFELSAGQPVRDTQNGMRLLRGRALELLPPRGGYEAETRHLKRVLRAGVPVSWTAMPAIYAGERSSFRALRDSGRVLWAIVAPEPRASTW
jgi:membrane-associated phospholipid phosphatase/predicted MFS family arabinose efflux permease